MPAHQILRIGTRGSPLALAQATEVRERLLAAHPGLAESCTIETVVIRTTGDAITNVTLAALGGKGLFTKELEQALIDGGVDLVVHSMKDVPTILPDGLVIDCVLPREDSRDALFTAEGGGLDSLAPGAVVGTASLRRQALILHARPDLQVVPFRGNVGTRLAKLSEGVVDATLLAVAGLRRLGQGDRIQTVLSPEVMMPAIAQGAIGIQRRLGDARVEALLAPLNDHQSELQITAERAFLATLDGSCRTPIAASTRITGDTLHLSGLVIRPDGSERHSATLSGSSADAARIGTEAGQSIKGKIDPGFFQVQVLDIAAR